MKAQFARVVGSEFGTFVIPREGVERFVRYQQGYVSERVIPREGVERMEGSGF